MTKKTQRCRKCNAEKGKPHKSTCASVRYPTVYPESALYIAVTDTGSSWSGSCDTSSSDSSGGGDCG